MSSLELNESLRSRAYRILKPLANFRPEADVPAEVRAQILPDETLLGVYVNAEIDPHANLVFTTRGIYHVDGGWTCLAYADITRVDIERGESFRKMLADTLVFRTRDGQTVHLTISGWKPKTVVGGAADLRFADIYEVLRFLLRVLERVNGHHR